MARQFDGMSEFPARDLDATLIGVDDEALLRRAEAALTEIKVNKGLSEEHASVLAALRIRLKGEAGGSLDSMLEAAGDLSSPGLEDLLGREAPKKGSLDDLLTQEPKKPEWPGG
jgi:hypothetical protein